MTASNASPSPPRLVVDTNLFVGFLFHPQAIGPSAVWRLWGAGKVRLVVSPAVAREYRRTIGRLPVAEERKREFMERLEDPQVVETIDPVPDSGFRCVDPEDDKFLHLAHAASAAALITADRALASVTGFPIPILKSGEWLRRSSLVPEEDDT